MESEREAVAKRLQGGARYFYGSRAFASTDKSQSLDAQIGNIGGSLERYNGELSVVNEAGSLGFARNFTISVGRILIQFANYKEQQLLPDSEYTRLTNLHSVNFGNAFSKVFGVVGGRKAAAIVGVETSSGNFSRHFGSGSKRFWNDVLSKSPEELKKEGQALIDSVADSGAANLNSVELRKYLDSKRFQSYKIKAELAGVRKEFENYTNERLRQVVYEVAKGPAAVSDEQQTFDWKFGVAKLEIRQKLNELVRAAKMKK